MTVQRPLYDDTNMLCHAQLNCVSKVRPRTRKHESASTNLLPTEQVFCYLPVLSLCKSEATFVSTAKSGSSQKKAIFPDIFARRDLILAPRDAPIKILNLSALTRLAASAWRKGWTETCMMWMYRRWWQLQEASAISSLY